MHKNRSQNILASTNFKVQQSNVTHVIREINLNTYLEVYSSLGPI